MQGKKGDPAALLRSPGGKKPDPDKGRGGSASSTSFTIGNRGKFTGNGKRQGKFQSREKKATERKAQRGDYYGRGRELRKKNLLTKKVQERPYTNSEKGSASNERTHLASQKRGKLSGSREKKRSGKGMPIHRRLGGKEVNLPKRRGTNP